MPRTRSLAWSELKVGVLAITAMVIAAVLIFMLGGQGGFFWQRYHLRTRFPNVYGVKQGSPVRVAGVEQGSVTGMRFVGAEVELDLQLSRTMQERVRAASRATIGSVSLLGEGAIDITATTDGNPIPDGGYIEPGAAPVQLSDAAARATQGIDQATQLIEGLRAGKGTVGRLLTDEALYRDLQGFVAAARAVTENLQHGQGSLGKLLNDPTTVRELDASLKNLSAITQRINAGQGSLGQLINDDAFAKSLTSAINNFDSITTKMNRGEGTLGKLATDSALYERLNSLTSRLDQIAERLTQGQGTAGQLLQDKQLYENMNRAVSELRDLVSDIRKDPKKFLNVKVSIF
jgi:phospholipid/cholesterol/gamma-HCH transport system substrate-binding protein